jgi:hypothetical protein
MVRNDSRGEREENKTHRQTRRPVANGQAMASEVHHPLMLLPPPGSKPLLSLPTSSLS